MDDADVQRSCVPKFLRRANFRRGENPPASSLIDNPLFSSSSEVEKITVIAGDERTDRVGDGDDTTASFTDWVSAEHQYLTDRQMEQFTVQGIIQSRFQRPSKKWRPYSPRPPYTTQLSHTMKSTKNEQAEGYHDTISEQQQQQQRPTTRSPFYVFSPCDFEPPTKQATQAKLVKHGERTVFVPISPKKSSSDSITTTFRNSRVDQVVHPSAKEDDLKMKLYTFDRFDEIASIGEKSENLSYSDAAKNRTPPLGVSGTKSSPSTSTTTSATSSSTSRSTSPLSSPGVVVQNENHNHHAGCRALTLHRLRMELAAKRHADFRTLLEQRTYPIPPPPCDDDDNNDDNNNGIKTMTTLGSSSERHDRYVPPLHHRRHCPDDGCDPIVLARRCDGSITNLQNLSVLLVDADAKSWEVVELKYNPNKTNVRDLLARARLAASDPLLRNQVYVGLCRAEPRLPPPPEKAKQTTLLLQNGDDDNFSMSTASACSSSSPPSSSSSSYNVSSEEANASSTMLLLVEQVRSTKEDLLVAYPDGCTQVKAAQMGTDFLQQLEQWNYGSFSCQYPQSTFQEGIVHMVSFEHLDPSRGL